MLIVLDTFNCGGEIKISHEADEKYLKTIISDNGIGILEENMNKLFTPYFRASGNGEIKGTGLGLYGVKKIIEENGGKITVDSKLGVGTTFTIILPLA